MRNLALNRGKLGWCAERPHFGHLGERITDPDFADNFRHPPQELICDSLLQIYPRPGNAALPGRGEDTTDAPVDRTLDIRILKHDERRFSTQFKRHLGKILRRILDYMLRRNRATGK